MSTKDKIIDVLADLIKHDENISDISVAKIAELADIAKSTVYEHFNSKEELVKETYCYLADYYRKRILAPLNGQTFETAFKELFLRMMKSAQEANELMMSIMSEGQGIKVMPKHDVEEIMEDIQQDVQSVLMDILTMGVKENVIHPKPQDRKEKGHIIRALTVGLIMQRVNRKIDLSEQDALDYIYKYSVIVLNA